MEHVPGLLYVMLSRTNSIEHIYIPESQWFNHFDIRLQRLNNDVLEAECFENMVRAIAAYIYRHFCKEEGNPYGDYWNNEDNSIADKIHSLWLHEQLTKEQVIERVLMNNASFTRVNVEKVYTRMENTDEHFLQEPAPHLSVNPILHGLFQLAYYTVNMAHQFCA